MQSKSQQMEFKRAAALMSCYGVKLWYMHDRDSLEAAEGNALTLCCHSGVMWHGVTCCAGSVKLGSGVACSCAFSAYSSLCWSGTVC